MAKTCFRKRSTVEAGTTPAKLPGPNTPGSKLTTELFVEGNTPTEKSLVYGKKLSAPTGLYVKYDEKRMNGYKMG